MPVAKREKWKSLKGHLGSTRPTPSITENKVHIKVIPDHCNECGSKNINVYQKHTTVHVEEDIQIIRTTNVYEHFPAYCYDCQKVSTPSASNETSNAYIGTNTRSVAIAMHYSGIPVRKVSNIMEDILQIKVSPNSIIRWEKELTDKLNPVYERIKERIREAESVNGDETSWWEHTNLRWLWIFITSYLCYYKIASSRGSKVVVSILGERFGGILNTDFYASYNVVLATYKQKCLAHLLRMLEKVQEPTKEEKDAMDELSRIITDAIKQYNTYKKGLIALERLHAYELTATENLLIWSKQNFINKKLHNIKELIKKHINELLVFMRFPDKTEPTNNKSERGLRRVAIMRSLTFGNRSSYGCHNMEVILSVLQTAKLHNKTTFNVIKAILESNSIQDLFYLIGGAHLLYKQLTLQFDMDTQKTGPPSH